MALVFSTRNATPQTYRTFIDALRLRLTAGRPTSHGIPVLPRNEDVQNAQRFLLVDLTNSENNTITVAIDVVNAYVVGYAAGGRSYFLAENAPDDRPPIHLLFPGTTRVPTLSFNGTYSGLSRGAEEAVRRRRASNRNPNINDKTPVLVQIPLGRNELDDAIRLLGLAASQSDQALGFIVIIQMLSEAARFRAIEGLVRTTMQEAYDPLTRGLGMESLETHWSDLSQEIQRVPEGESRFRNNRTIVLHNIGNERREVNSVDSPFVQGVAMLLYDRVRN
ncbi:ribosome-inactivating protein bryodin II-like [Prunus yedoensis var. nudiflora]|uniref:rRNA N-glycosylase n=1 Tax=Prunus yedoensis var. nudiflora TaxID=2094558 RepID=A0A314XVV7_PRUYE|nr:ribosome-inactivating protein bryodin II-like [Prunus yedoensis var. nudiflora]